MLIASMVLGLIATRLRILAASDAVPPLGKANAMAYRTILVDLTNSERMEERLRTAQALAVSFDAALIGLHVVAPPLDLGLVQGGYSVYISPEVIAGQAKAGRDARDSARALFERVCAGRATASWQETEGDLDTSLAEAARASDVVVVTRGKAVDIVEQLVTATGVPVLALPPDGASGGDLGRTVLVAWNGAREATRAVHDALPLLQRADRVILCAVGARAAAALGAVVAMLERHEIPVEPQQIEAPDGDAGKAMLDEAATQGADLLVMGAYGHSRLRELVLGGATRHILHHATLPVLFGN